MSVPCQSANPTGMPSGAVPGAAHGAAHGAAQARRLGFGGALRAEWCKVWSVTSTYVLLVLAIVFFAVNSLMMGWLMRFVESQGDGMPLGNEDLWAAVSSGADNVLLIVGILGVMVLTSEFSSSSIITSLTVNPRRVMFMNAKAVVLAAVTFLASFVGALLSWGCAAIMLGSSLTTGNAEMPAAMPWVTLFGVPLAMALGAVLSMGFGALCRSTVGGVLCVVVLFMIVPSMLQMVQLLGEKFTWVVSLNNCLPANTLVTFAGTGANSFVNSANAQLTMGSSHPFQPSWGWAGLIYVVWAVVIYTAGVFVMSRRDVK